MWQNLLSFLLDIQSKPTKRGFWHTLGQWRHSIQYCHVHGIVTYTLVNPWTEDDLVRCHSVTIMSRVLTHQTRGSPGHCWQWRKRCSQHGEALYWMLGFAVNLRLNLCRSNYAQKLCYNRVKTKKRQLPSYSREAPCQRCYLVCLSQNSRRSETHCHTQCRKNCKPRPNFYN